MLFFFIVAVASIIVTFLILKHLIWDLPHDEINRLKSNISNLEAQHRMEISNLKKGHAEILSNTRKDYQCKIDELQNKVNDGIFVSEKMKSNIRAIPYMAGIMADFETYGLEKLVRKLDWGYSQERLKKVKAIQEIRKDAEEMVKRNKEAQYQLAYLLQLYPALQDIIDSEYSQLPIIEVKDLSEYDNTRMYLSSEEYNRLGITARNQLALDRYITSHNKSKWQIGRDYELFTGYMYSQEGYSVDYFGEINGLSDLGRDLIVKKANTVKIIQCKYWSREKQIHEKHINQLYGTMTCYCFEHGMKRENVSGVLVTNTRLSDTAKRFADYLGIEYKEYFECGNYPRIKCNIGRDEYGIETKIYHLPFDQQYDSAKISKPGELMAMTVLEAEKAGFRRASRWFGN